ncbi:Gfo/Idh/MocA family protein [Nonlabens xiamenensis]|uniref:Gfo/Idh/MocA family protein n=1 Tax=Nonlabens xiamenensis TaxID=2341043 RepID=UPI000F6129EC|nr:Gfo/Idh/MocA family oxidoreductase [Nonlabens xiamenensis]
MVKFGILGLGKIAHKFASDLALVTGCQLYAVGSRSMSKAKEFAEKHAATIYYDNYTALIQDPEVDVVYVATPHVFHYEYSMMCLKAGKGVLCEKPLGMNSQQVEEMICLAQEQQVFLMEAMWTRFIPATHKLLELLDQQVIGKITNFQADFGFRAPQNPNDRVIHPSLGGGSLLDIGIYPIYLGQLVLGKPIDIKASAQLSQTGIDLQCAILTTYQKGAIGILHSSLISNTPTEAIFYGELGQIKLHSRFHHTQKISLQLKDGTEQVFDLPYSGQGYVHEIVEVRDAINNGATASHLHSLENSRQLMETLDDIRNIIGLTYPADS